MFERLVEILDQLNERESKALLLRLFMEARVAEKVPNGEKRLSLVLSRMYEELIHLQPEQPLSSRDLNHYHIVCGDSATGSLKVALSAIGAKRKKVISLSADLSVGPLSKLDEPDRMKGRIAWIKGHLTDFNEESEHPITESVKAICAIPENMPITIWTSDNAWEQCGLYFIVHLLKGRSNEIQVINPSAHYERIVEKNSDVRVSYSHTGEMSPESLGLFFKKCVSQPPLSDSEREQLNTEWTRVSHDQSFLRIWKDNHIQNVSTDYFDSTILNIARQLAYRKENKDGILCMRLIGEAIGQIREQQFISDSFIAFRIKEMVRSGKMEIKKDPNRILHAYLTLN